MTLRQLSLRQLIIGSFCLGVVVQPTVAVSESNWTVTNEKQGSSRGYHQAGRIRSRTAGKQLFLLPPLRFTSGTIDSRSQPSQPIRHQVPALGISRPINSRGHGSAALGSKAQRTQRDSVINTPKNETDAYGWFRERTKVGRTPSIDEVPALTRQSFDRAERNSASAVNSTWRQVSAANSKRISSQAPAQSKAIPRKSYSDSRQAQRTGERLLSKEIEPRFRFFMGEDLGNYHSDAARTESVSRTRTTREPVSYQPVPQPAPKHEKGPASYLPLFASESKGLEEALAPTPVTEASQTSVVQKSVPAASIAEESTALAQAEREPKPQVTSHVARFAAIDDRRDVAEEVAPTAVPSNRSRRANEEMASIEPMVIQSPFDDNLLESKLLLVWLLPRMHYIAGGQFMTRNIATSQIVVVDASDFAETPPIITPLLRTDELDFDSAFGPRFEFLFDLSKEEKFGIEYFELFDWMATTSVSGNGNLTIPGPLSLSIDPSDFVQANRVQLNYSSDLRSLEFNYRCQVNWPLPHHCFDVLIGSRYMSLEEHFNLNSADVHSLVTPSDSDYNIVTKNHLFGIQIGAIYDFQIGIFDFIASSKASILHNATERRTHLDDFQLPDILNVNVKGNTESFVGELGLTGIVHLTRHVSLHGGYQVMWIDGVALAPAQFEFTDTAILGEELHDNGGVFLHGARAALEIHWGGHWSL